MNTAQTLKKGKRRTTVLPTERLTRAALQQKINEGATERLTKAATQQQTRNAIAERQTELLRSVGSNFAIPQNVRQAPAKLTLGIPAIDINDELTPEGVRGRMLGFGTYKNIVNNPHAFNTKQPVNMTQDWADYLQKMFQDDVPTAEAALANGNVLDYSIGLAGVHRDAPGQEPTIKGFYQSGIQFYSQDDRATLSVSTIEGSPVVLLPGSTKQRLAAQNGLSVGLVSVKNPSNGKGYVKVGSKGWRDTIAKWYNGLSPQADLLSMQHFIGQGSVYGLGQIFAKHGIVVTQEAGPQTIRYVLRDGIENVAGNNKFFADVTAFYNAYLKNPDQQRLGLYGAASFAARHAGGAIEGGSNAIGLTGQNYIAAVEQGLAKGNLKGLWKFKSGSKTPKDRRGLTAFPMRTKDGVALARDQYFDNAGGFCNPSGSGVGVSQRATNGGEFGERMYKTKKDYISKAAGRQGQPIPDTQPLYKCGPTSDNFINANRKIYQKGGKRGTTNYGLNDAINLAQQTMVANGGYGEYANLTADQLQQRYQEWINPANYEKNGTNPFYMLDPTSMGEKKKGFSKSAPKAYAALMSDEARAKFNASRPLNHAVKNVNSDRLLNAIKANPKTVATSIIDRAIGGQDRLYTGMSVPIAEAPHMKPSNWFGAR